MNEQRLTFGHVAPVRLRNGIRLGYEQVKWLKGFEFVATMADIGGYSEDHEFVGYRQTLISYYGRRPVSSRTDDDDPKGRNDGEVLAYRARPPPAC